MFPTAVEETITFSNRANKLPDPEPRTKLLSSWTGDKD